MAVWLHFPRRLLLAPFQLLLASILLFSFLQLFSLVDRVGIYAGGRPTSAAALEAVIRKYGLDRPIYEQYWFWLMGREDPATGEIVGGVLRGNLGYSLMTRQPVGDVVARTLPNTLLLWGASLLFALPLAAAGAGVGVLLHWLEGRSGPAGSALKGLGRLLTFPLAAAPAFGLGLLLMLIFAIWLRWLPMAGMYSPGARPGELGELVGHLILPALTLAPLPATLIAQAVAREATLPRAGGGWRLWVGGLLRGLATLFGLAGLWLSLLVLLEAVFNWPGVGRLMAQSALRLDTALLLGLLLVSALLVLAGRLLAELFRALERWVRVAPLSPPPYPAPWRQKARRLYVLVALALLVLPLALFLAGLAVSPAAAEVPDRQAPVQPPSPTHPLGTDGYGRDLLARTVRGGLASIGLPFLAAAVILVPGALGGALTGWLASQPTFWRESLADLLLLVTDAVLLLPPLPAALFIMTLLLATIGPTWLLVPLSLAIVLVPRAVSAAQALWLAAPSPRRPLLLIVGGSGALLLGLLYAAFALQAGLDFLGVGVPSPTPSLGNSVEMQYVPMGNIGVLVPILMLALCAAVLYTASDALIGYFLDKGVVARLNA